MLGSDTPPKGPAMSTLVEKIYAQCALNQAPEYVERFFASHERLQLRAPISIAGIRTELEKPVDFTLSPAKTGSDMIPTFELRWEPDGGGPYPSFDGTVSIEADDDYSRCAIALRGSYEPPLGNAGKTFDAAMGQRIARATARTLLAEIRDYIEAAYQETEREKQFRAVR